MVRFNFTGILALGFVVLCFTLEVNGRPQDNRPSQEVPSNSLESMASDNYSMQDIATDMDFLEEKWGERDGEPQNPKRDQPEGDGEEREQQSSEQQERDEQDRDGEEREQQSGEQQSGEQQSGEQQSGEQQSGEQQSGEQQDQQEQQEKDEHEQDGDDREEQSGEQQERDEQDGEQLPTQEEETFELLEVPFKEMEQLETDFPIDEHPTQDSQSNENAQSPDSSYPLQFEFVVDAGKEHEENNYEPGPGEIPFNSNNSKNEFMLFFYGNFLHWYYTIYLPSAVSIEQGYGSDPRTLQVLYVSWLFDQSNEGRSIPAYNANLRQFVKVFK